MLRVLVIAAIVFAVLLSRVGVPLFDYLQQAAKAITRSFNP